MIQRKWYELNMRGIMIGIEIVNLKMKGTMLRTFLRS